MFVDGSVLEARDLMDGEDLLLVSGKINHSQEHKRRQQKNPGKGLVRPLHW